MGSWGQSDQGPLFCGFFWVGQSSVALVQAAPCCWFAGQGFQEIRCLRVHPWSPNKQLRHDKSRGRCHAHLTLQHPHLVCVSACFADAASCWRVQKLEGAKGASATGVVDLAVAEPLILRAGLRDPTSRSNYFRTIGI